MRLFPESVQPDAKLLVGAKGLRAVADGFVSILLPAYLVALGYDATEVGILATATLLGSATATLLVGLITARYGYRRLGELLKRKGERVNHKRLFRVYRAAGLSVKRKRRKSLVRVGQPNFVATRPFRQ